MIQKQDLKKSGNQNKSKNALVSTIKMLFIIGKQPTEPSCTRELYSVSTKTHRKTHPLTHTFDWEYTAEGIKKCSYINCKCDAYCGPK